MFVLELKPKEELLSYLVPNTLVIKCIGCREIYLPEDKIDSFLEERDENMSRVLTFDYICNRKFIQERLNGYKNEIEQAERILVFSCGVGAQLIAKLLEPKIVIQGCDTVHLSGFQGITPRDYDCAQCNECNLNLTGGICPLTSCSKGLLSGPCGGSKDGKCEIAPEKECGWHRIYERLKKRGELENLKKLIRPRDYSKMLSIRQKATN